MHTAAGLPLPQLSRGRFSYELHEDGAALSGEVIAWTDEALFAATGVRIAFSERSGGYSEPPYATLNLHNGLGDDVDVVALNRKVLSYALTGEAVALLSPNQVHEDSIYSVLSNDPAVVARAEQDMEDGHDAVLCTTAGVGALLRFADCLPVILVAPNGSFAVAHCGWRGAVAHLAAKTLDALVAAAQCDPAQVNAYIGPYIHTECFEVDEKTAQRFADEFAEEVVARPVSDGDGFHVDLGASVRHDLTRAGLDPARVADIDVCTSCSTDRFFSYRADNGVTGRHGAFAYQFSDRAAAPVGSLQES